MNRGGYRPNAGRKKGSGKWGEATRAIRVPISKLDAIYKLLLLPSDKSTIINREEPPSSDSLISPISDIYYRPLYTAATLPNTHPPHEPTEKFNLNAYLLPHPDHMIFVRAPDRAMINEGIDTGNIVMVDTCRPIGSNCLIAALVNDELLIRRVVGDKNGLLLSAANPLFPAIHLSGDIRFTLLGVVRVVVHEV